MGQLDNYSGTSRNEYEWVLHAHFPCGEKMVTEPSLSGNLSSSSCTVGLCSWTLSSEAYFVSSCQNILRIMLVIFHLPEFFSCLTLSSVIRAAILFWFSFQKMLASCENIQKYFFYTKLKCFCFLVCFLKSPRIKDWFPVWLSRIITWGAFSCLN